MICPACDNILLWRDDKWLRCGRCDGWWICNGDEPANTLIGNWDESEVRMIESAMSHYCDCDFVFFKGRKIITVWIEGRSPKDVLVFKNMRELLMFLNVKGIS